MNNKDRLQQIFRRIFDDDAIEITRELSAEDIEDWDSLLHIQLILEIEKEFGVKFLTEEILELNNVGEFMDLIEQKQSSSKTETETMGLT